MRVTEREPGNLARLAELIAHESDADQRDRYRIVVLAVRGLEKLEIAELLGVCNRTVEDWAYRYRDHGLAALIAKPRGGSRSKLRGSAAERLKARLEAGPTAAARVCTLRGRDVQRIAREELGTDLSLAAAYRTLHRLGYSCLFPRPRHEWHDPATQTRFKGRDRPPDAQTIRDALTPHGGRVAEYAYDALTDMPISSGLDFRGDNLSVVQRTR